MLWITQYLNHKLNDIIFVWHSFLFFDYTTSVNFYHFRILVLF